MTRRAVNNISEGVRSPSDKHQTSNIKPQTSNERTVIIIAGPTAVGKTSVAIEVAKHFNTEIISADSRQCFRELKIGVARPSDEELAQVKHHFIASHSIHEKVTAATFEKYALEKANEIFKKNPVVVMVGGTGLYIRAFCEGMDEIPEVPEGIRQDILREYESKGIDWLQEQARLLDPEFYERGEIKNPQRLMRAIEVSRSTGRSILSFRKIKNVTRDFSIVKTALFLPKDELHYNIHARVDRMMENGLVEEARSLIPYQHLNALQTVGYREMFDHFRGETTLEQAVSFIKTNTRQYAKRQMTWFKKDSEFIWTSPDAQKLTEAIHNHRF